MYKDKLDKINMINYYKSNIIKWWSIKAMDVSESFIVGKGNTDIYLPEPDDCFCLEQLEHEDDMNPEALSESEKLLLEQISSQHDSANAFDDAQNQLLIDEANAIFERLQAEAAYDEAQKQAEIEQAMIANQ